MCSIRVCGLLVQCLSSVLSLDLAVLVSAVETLVVAVGRAPLVTFPLFYRKELFCKRGMVFDNCNRSGVSCVLCERE